MPSRLLAIGDIHGCLRAFETMLGIVQPTPEDTVVLMGDYVDRGPDSCGVLDRVMRLESECTLVPLFGNHEQMMLDSREDKSIRKEWLQHGGRETLDSYVRRGFGKGIDKVPAAHWNFIEARTVDFWETDKHIFVHASLDPELGMEEQTEGMLFWERLRNPTVHRSGKAIICGHTTQPAGLPAIFQTGICIDTWVYGAGWLTCYDVSKGTFWQTNERGVQRTFDLAKLVRL